MEPKTPPGYEKLLDDKPPKSPKSPKSPGRPFRLRFHRMLSAGSLKTGSSSPATPSPGSDGKHYCYDCESVDVFNKSRQTHFEVPKQKLSRKKTIKMLLSRKKRRRGHKRSTAKLQQIPLIKVIESDEEWYGTKQFS